MRKINEKLKTAMPFLIVLAGLIVAGLLIFLFAQLSDEVLENELYTLDLVGITFVSIFQTPVLDSLMGAVTFLGDVWVLAVLSVVLLLFLHFKTKDNRQAVVFLIMIAGTGALIWLLKEFFERDRPQGFSLGEEGGFSFPSGHSLGALAFYGFLIYVLMKSRQQLWVKAVVAGLLAALISLIGASRIYLGVHFPTDVAAGFFTGAAWLIFCILALEWMKEGTSREKEAGKATADIALTFWRGLKKRFRPKD